MEELKKYQKFVFAGIGLLAFLLLTICPAVDVLGKYTMSSFKYVFDAEDAGFSRFLMLLMILAPLATAAYAFLIPESKWGKNLIIFFGATVVIDLITIGALPQGLSFASGSWIHFVISLAGAALAYVFYNARKKINFKISV